jgi:hypothetical protein
MLSALQGRCVCCECCGVHSVPWRRWVTVWRRRAHDVEEGTHSRRGRWRLQVQFQIIIDEKARGGVLKVRLEKRRPLHAKIQVVVVVAEELLKVRFRPEF